MTDSEIKKIPKWFKKKMYDDYVFNCKLYGKKILPYKEWLEEVKNAKL